MSAIQKFKFKLGAVERTIIGGPYMQRYPDHLGIKMAVEIRTPCNIDIPTRDFDVPKVEDLDKGIRASLIPIARGKPVYVGCMGGIGRTGLFLAALAKTVGINEPVKYVRANYKPHAVETQQQMEYIAAFQPSLKTKLTANIAKAIALFN